MKAEAIAKKIKLVCLDVDGVLTDGSIIISGQGELFKQFYVRDGLGIKFLQDCGIQVGGKDQAIRMKKPSLNIPTIKISELCHNNVANPLITYLQA